jgi:hypothetical protein
MHIPTALTATSAAMIIFLCFISTFLSSPFGVHITVGLSELNF